MNALIIDLLTKQPVLVSALDGDPNSANSFGYIPGSVIRGALIGRYLQGQTTESQITLLDLLPQRLFFSNHVRFLHAYPVEPTSQVRMLPSIQKLSKPEPAQTTLPRIKERKYEWIGRTSKCDTVRHLNIHTTRNRAKGRSLRGSGTVYRYVAIAPNQVFQAVILGNAADLAEFMPLLDSQPSLWLGKARSAGYGAVQIITIKQVTDWNELPYSPKGQPSSGETITMTLLSDAIIRDQYGQYARIGSEQSVNEYAPVDLAASFGLEQGQLRLTKSKLRYTVLGGFNRTWGLPLPQTPALAAGSVLVWEQAKADWQRLLEQGIGERRNEGFGRISVDSALPTHAANVTPGSALITHQLSTPYLESLQIKLFATESTKMLELMGERLIRQRLDQRLITLIGTYKLSLQTDSRNSLLGRVELWCRDLLVQVQHLVIDASVADTPFSILATLHQKVEQTAKIARQHLNHITFDYQHNAESTGIKPLVKTLQALLSLKFEALLDLWQIEPFVLGDQRLQVTPALALEYYARLVIAIVTMARKQPFLEQ